MAKAKEARVGQYAAFNEALKYMYRRQTGEEKSIYTPWPKFNDATTDGLEWNTPVENKKLNRKISNLVFKNQANVFSGMAHIYSPIYRQMHIHGYKDNINGIKAFDIAYEDIEKAFKYYLKYFIKGNRFEY